MRIFSSAEYCLRVARRISRTCCSAVPAGSDFRRIFIPLQGYDEPEILQSSMQPFCLMVADGGHQSGELRSPGDFLITWRRQSEGLNSTTPLERPFLIRGRRD